MKIKLGSNPSRGIALMMVLIVLLVLGVLAGGFAYSMRVETKLARNTSFEGDLEWIGRSGVEFARYVLVQHLNVFNEPWDSLNQKWAGGPMGTNEVLEALSLENNTVGQGTFSIKITDTERKFNINSIAGNTYSLQQGLMMAGADPGEIPSIQDAFLDWIDPNDDAHLHGAESSDYISNPNPGFAPYIAKNGPLDDITELLLVRGITPEMFWGGNGGRKSIVNLSPSPFGNASEGSAALVDLFTTLSEGSLNINTAPASVLQLVIGVDARLAQFIIEARAGLDGVEGTDDDRPFRSVGDLGRVPGMIPQLAQQLQASGMFKVRSYTFEVVIDAKISDYKRQFVALVRRNPSNPRDIQTLYFHWK
jgi:general secretion pathway protein K